MITQSGDHDHQPRVGAWEGDGAWERFVRQDAFAPQIGDGRFTTFRTGASKSRLAFLSALRAGHGEYVISEAALEYMRSVPWPGR